MANAKVIVNLADGSSYDVRIGSGMLDGLGDYLVDRGSYAQVLIISDSNVAPHYLAQAKAALRHAGYTSIDIVIPAGESSKTLECAGEIWNAMAAAKLSRDCLVVALGGGVVGDIAGFVASTYMRGVPYVQVPTSLLAMVDSSVGGKTGVNLEAGKNLVGSFKQPEYVAASLETLDTLPDREWRCGFAEIAKSALLDSDDFLFWLMDSAPALVRHDRETVAEAVARSVVFKADVVGVDEKESRGVRECLNYGHTLGHAIETLAGYGTFSHGEAVAEGMRFAVRLGAALMGTSADLVYEQDDLLDALGLPSLDWSADPQAMLEAMMGDKKVRDNELRFVLLRDVGAWEVVAVDADTVLEHLEAWTRSKNT